MNELQVETIKLEPAKITFNHEEIAKELDESLAKYSKLTFTEENTTEIRSLLAELRKGKNAVNRYRIDTKKKLTTSITEFEDKCKVLTEKFDNTINPINEQLQTFVERQRQEKREKLEQERKRLIEEYELDEKYAKQIEIENSYLNASTSLRQATESIEFEIQNFKNVQEKEKADKQVIESTAELARERYNVSIATESYIRLLEFEDVNDIKTKILDDAQKEVERLEREIERKRQEEERRKEIAQRKLEEQEKKESIKSEPLNESKPSDDMPFGDIVEQEEEKEVYYTINATKSELALIEKFLDDNNISWKNGIEMELPF